ncbi:MAG TPA: sugar ABC transporter permease [Chloroflexota bacterium]|jgi:multiple sugar transport system permease protein|nr:sugar ABC transporter permease [Chloroflexota bacterium]
MASQELVGRPQKLHARGAVSLIGKRSRGKNRHTVIPWVLLTPWLIGFCAITLGPMLASLYLSMTDYNLLGDSTWVGFANYIRMFTDDPKFLTSAGVTLNYVLVSVPLQLAFALAIAVLLNQGLAGLAFYRSMYYLPSLLGSSVAIALLWRQIFGSAGLINQVLGAIGFTNLPAWIATPDHALQTLILLHVWTFGSPMIIFLAGLRQVPQDLYEAAAVDGAGAWTKFWRITIPMLSPVIFFNLVLQMIHAFQTFTQSYVISSGTGGPVNSTLVYTLYMYQQAFSNFHMGYASAMAWLLVLVVGALTAIAFGTSKHWVHYAGEK